jgi:hypothetical protein
MIIELTREEFVFASGKYHMGEKKQSGKSDDTVEDETKEELMISLGIMEGGSRAGQGNKLNLIIAIAKTQNIFNV